MELTEKGRKVRNFALAALVLSVGTCGIVRFKNRLAPDRPAAGAVSASAFGTTGDAATPTTQDNLGRPLKVAINVWPGYAPGLVANGGSLAPSASSAFARHGLQVQFVVIDDFAASRTAFREGAIDVLWGTVDAMAQEAPGMASLEPRAFLQFDYSHGGDAIAATGTIRQVSDLRGKRVAYAAGTPSQYLLVWALSQAGLRLSDVTSVTTATAPDAARAFTTGSVDAAVSWDPDVVNAANGRPGGHILLSTASADHLIADIFIARQAFIRDHGSTLARFAAGWFEGVRMLRDNRTLGAQALASCLPGVTAEDAPAMLNNATYSTYADNRGFFGLDRHDVVTFSSIFRSATNVWRGVGLISQIAQPEMVSNNTVLAAINDAEQAIEPTRAEAPRVYTVTDGGTPATVALTRRVSLQFPVGSSTLDGNAEFALNAINELASTAGGAVMQVQGNTDDTGNPDSNRALSRQRAEAIVNWLMAHGTYDRSKFQVAGNGSDNPVCREATPECRARNRRTDFIVVPVGN